MLYPIITNSTEQLPLRIGNTHLLLVKLHLDPRLVMLKFPESYLLLEPVQRKSFAISLSSHVCLTWSWIQSDNSHLVDFSRRSPGDFGKDEIGNDHGYRSGTSEAARRMMSVDDDERVNQNSWTRNTHKNPVFAFQLAPVAPNMSGTVKLKRIPNKFENAKAHPAVLARNRC